MHNRCLKTASLAISLFTFAGCGDSTGPAPVGGEEALRSLARGFGPGSVASLPFGMSPTALGTGGSIDQINVTIDGTTHSMFALGWRVTYPTGTCFESLFLPPISIGFPAGECTPPAPSLVLVLWETQSGSRPPDRMVLISADVGTASFDSPFSDIYGVDHPPPPPVGGGGLNSPHSFAAYIEPREEFWGSVGGSLTSQVAATSETCSLTPPPFAKSATCHVATFDESGRITFERFDLVTFSPGTGPVRQTMELVIPRQTIRGILQAITEVQPVTLPTP